MYVIYIIYIMYVSINRYVSVLVLYIHLFKNTFCFANILSFQQKKLQKDFIEEASDMTARDLQKGMYISHW